MKKNRWENIFKIDRRETGCEDVSWIEVVPLRVKWVVFMMLVMKRWLPCS
jgi:hypothetical protein